VCFLKTPPPDEPAYTSAATSKSPARPWFPAHPTSSHNVDASYQSGGIPTFNPSAGGLGAEHAETQQNQWETRYGMRVDVLAAVAYLLGPISGAYTTDRPIDNPILNAPLSIESAYH